MQARKQGLGAQSRPTYALSSIPGAWPVLIGEVSDQRGFKEYQGFPPNAFSPVSETCVHRLHATILPLASAIPASGGEAASEEP